MAVGALSRVLQAVAGARCHRGGTGCAHVGMVASRVQQAALGSRSWPPTHCPILVPACISPAGTPYPPPLAQSIRLHQALRDGRLESVWTGGGCLARPLARSRGRYVLLVIEADIARVEQRLARLPPINAWEVARLQRHKEREREARAAAREARRAERKARAAECEAAGAAAAPAAEPAAAAAVEGG